MLFNIPPICRKPLVFVDENGVLSQTAVFEQFLNYSEWVTKTPTQKDGYVRFYSFDASGQRQKWCYATPVNLTSFKRIYIRKFFDVTVRLYKTKPMSGDSFDRFYDFSFNATYIGEDKYVIDQDISGITGEYWIVWYYDHYGAVIDPEEAVYNFYIV